MSIKEYFRRLMEETASERYVNKYMREKNIEQRYRESGDGISEETERTISWTFIIIVSMLLISYFF